ncbi:solute carrier family 25 member 3-like [Prorops nasuta]|uniref:solute carrier family 25 member 3-like n=1 Tax=Prorops nasuta TaxID=863751 RepID=UPI0034CFDEC4
MTAHNPNERQEFVYAISSSSAEFFADFALAPFEVCKVRMQTSAESSRSFVQTVRTIINEEGLKSLYKNLIPLWLRQVPYTMTKFTTFETTLESIYKFVLLKPREDCSEGQQLAATFAAGYIAGIICAAVSHPADSVISKLGQAKSLSIVETTRKLGWYGIWRGLGSRTLMIGTLTGLQWLAYDSFKTLFNVPRSKAPGK